MLGYLNLKIWLVQAEQAITGISHNRAGLVSLIVKEAAPR